MLVHMRKISPCFQIQLSFIPNHLSYLLVLSNSEIVKLRQTSARRLARLGFGTLCANSLILYFRINDPTKSHTLDGGSGFEGDSTILDVPFLPKTNQENESKHG